MENTDQNLNKKMFRIMLVDDDHFLLNMYSVKFKASGFDVQVAAGADEALAKINGGFVPDLMLLDIVMPGMDGIEFLNKIRTEKLIPNTKIVMLSNQSQQADIDRVKALGIAGYIVKATTIPSEVVSETQKILQGGQPSAVSAAPL